MRRLALVLALLPATASAQGLAERPGWRIIETERAYADLIEAVKTATEANGMGVVTEAGPTEAAAARGVTIPGNRVIGVFNNGYAVDILALSTAAMIEAPVRFYVTETADGAATLAWKIPSAVFAPYADEGGDALATLAAELDTKFEAIAAAATAD